MQQPINGISATAPRDYIFTGHQLLNFDLPGTLKVIVYPATHLGRGPTKQKYFPIFSDKGYTEANAKSGLQNFVMVDCFNDETPSRISSFLDELANDPTVVLCLKQHQCQCPAKHPAHVHGTGAAGHQNPVVLITDSSWQTPDEHLIHFATETGGLFLDGFGDGICLGYSSKSKMDTVNVSGRTISK